MEKSCPRALPCPAVVSSPASSDIPCKPPPLVDAESLTGPDSLFLRLIDELVQEYDRVVFCVAQAQDAWSEPEAPAGIGSSQLQREADLQDEAAAAQADDVVPLSSSSKFSSSHYFQDGFQLWPCWEVSMYNARNAKPWGAVGLDAVAQYHRQQSAFSSGRTGESSGSQLTCLIRPDSQTRIVWDFIGLVLLIYDLFRIPLLAFDPPKLLFLQSGDWVTIVYWTIDILASFITGYYRRDGTMVTDVRKIGWRYFKSWLGPDLFVVGADWVTTLIEITNTTGQQDSSVQALGILRIGKVARLGRILRILRLARLAKLNNIVFMIQERVSSESISIAVGVLKNMLLLLALNHIFACLWFWVGSAHQDEKSWVGVYQMAGAEFSEQYVVSLHWTLTQFTPAGMHVQPQNLQERTFNVVLIVIAMISFSTFVSSITSSMTRLRMIHEDDTTAMIQLRKYLSQNTISRALCSRIERFISLAKEMHRKRLHPSKVELLQLLSGPLSIELHYELHSPTLSVHGFLSEYNHCDRSALSELCFTAIHGLALSKRDHLFDFGARALSMYFITSGTLAYKQPKHDNGVFRPWINVSVGKWACEAALWMPWAHRGTMITVVECDVIALDGDKFREVTVARRDAFMHSKDHAVDFLQDMIRTRDTYGYCWDVPVQTLLDKGTCAKRRDFSYDDFSDLEAEVAIAEEVEAELMQ